MPQETSKPGRCPGFEGLRNLSSFVCKCPGCDKELEIFSDGLNRPHTCAGCGKPIDFSRCDLEARGMYRRAERHDRNRLYLTTGAFTVDDKPGSHPRSG